jgi:hypothetical protein
MAAQLLCDGFRSAHVLLGGVVNRQLHRSSRRFYAIAVDLCAKDASPAADLAGSAGIVVEWREAVGAVVLASGDLQLVLGRCHLFRLLQEEHAVGLKVHVNGGGVCAGCEGSAQRWHRALVVGGGFRRACSW